MDVNVDYELLTIVLLTLVIGLITYLKFTRTRAHLHFTSKSPQYIISEDEITKEVELLRRTEENGTTVLATTDSRPKRNKYRIDEEKHKKASSEFTRRGMLWSCHATWYLPSAPRDPVDSTLNLRRFNSQGLEHVIASLTKYNVHVKRGFLPSQDPLQRLPFARYHIWEDLGDDLSKLLGARLGQARDPLRNLPVLKTDKLITDDELRRAHLLLCLFAHAYVWGGQEPLDVIPKGIAIPLWEVSKRLGIPPILGHPSIVLYNWRRLDSNADICMENISTLNNFFDGRDESWFYLITVEVEARGAAAVVPMMLAIDAIQRYNEEREIDSLDGLDLANGRRSRQSSFHESNSCRGIDSSSDVTYPLGERRILSHDDDDGDNDEETISLEEALIGELCDERVILFVTGQLKKIAGAIDGMCSSIDTMREGCHPFIFYHRVRPFLSGWKDNPILPNGVIYEGVSDERFQFYGGSAAQSALIPFLDIGLGVSHANTKSQEFLLAMRDYMPRSHREFLTYVEVISCSQLHALLSRSVACIREFILKHAECKKNSKDLNMINHDKIEMINNLMFAYDQSIQNIQRFRNLHMSLVASYILAQQEKPARGKSLEGSAGGKGTGGTELMKFLKPVRDDCTKCLMDSELNDNYRIAPPAADARAAANVLSNFSTSRRPSEDDLGQKSPGRISFMNNTDDALTYLKRLNALPELEEPYKKDNAGREDIDLFRGAAYSITNVKYVYRQPMDVSDWNTGGWFSPSDSCKSLV